jgi:hypothetical protein
MLFTIIDQNLFFVCFNLIKNNQINASILFIVSLKFCLKIFILCITEIIVNVVKVAVFVGGVDTSATETKGTVLIHSAEQV